jgi:hypothetical protein
MADDEFPWVKEDATGILGSARPRDLAGLLKKKPGLWHDLYLGWLDHHHEGHADGFRFVRRGRSAVEDRTLWDQWAAALGYHFPAFVTDIGKLKQALDGRTGTSRRFAHLTGQAASAVQDVAGSRIVTGVAGDAGGLVAKAAGKVGAAAGPKGPLAGRLGVPAAPPAPPTPGTPAAAGTTAAPGTPAVPMAAKAPAAPATPATPGTPAARATRAASATPSAPAAQAPATATRATQAKQAASPVRKPPAAPVLPPGRAFAKSEDLKVYFTWLHETVRHLELLNLTGLVTALRDTADYAGQWRVALAGAFGADAVTQASDALAYYVALRNLAEPPHRTLATLVNELHSRSAHALYRRVRPTLEEVFTGLDGMYAYGDRALTHADGDWPEPAAYRAELAGMWPPPAEDAERAEADETAARDLFGQSFDDFPD